jgi:hypothetical protein
MESRVELNPVNPDRVDPYCASDMLYMSSFTETGQKSGYFQSTTKKSGYFRSTTKKFG